MTVSLNIPDSVASSLSLTASTVPQAILEGFAVESYRQGVLSAMQVRLLLGHESRWETQEFLAAHDAVRGLTVEEVLMDAKVATLARTVA